MNMRNVDSSIVHEKPRTGGENGSNSPKTGSAQYLSNFSTSPSLYKNLKKFQNSKASPSTQPPSSYSDKKRSRSTQSTAASSSKSYDSTEAKRTGSSFHHESQPKRDFDSHEYLSGFSLSKKPAPKSSSKTLESLNPSHETFLRRLKPPANFSPSLKAESTDRRLGVRIFSSETRAADKKQLQPPKHSTLPFPSSLSIKSKSSAALPVPCSSSSLSSSSSSLSSPSSTSLPRSKQQDPGAGRKQVKIVSKASVSRETLAVAVNKAEAAAQCKRKRKMILPQVTVEYLRDWLMSPDHILHPYPTEEQKRKIMRDTGIDSKRLSTWFANNRKRFWKPHLVAMNEDHSTNLPNSYTTSFNKAIAIQAKRRKKGSKAYEVLASSELVPMSMSLNAPTGLNSSSSKSRASSSASSTSSTSPTSAVVKLEYSPSSTISTCTATTNVSTNDATTSANAVIPAGARERINLPLKGSYNLKGKIKGKKDTSSRRGGSSPSSIEPHRVAEEDLISGSPPMSPCVSSSVHTFPSRETSFSPRRGVTFDTKSIDSKNSALRKTLSDSLLDLRDGSSLGTSCTTTQNLSTEGLGVPRKGSLDSVPYNSRLKATLKRQMYEAMQSSISQSTICGAGSRNRSLPSSAPKRRSSVNGTSVSRGLNNGTSLKSQSQSKSQSKSKSQLKLKLKSKSKSKSKPDVKGKPRGKPGPKPKAKLSKGNTKLKVENTKLRGVAKQVPHHLQSTTINSTTSTITTPNTDTDTDSTATNLKISPASKGIVLATSTFCTYEEYIDIYILMPRFGMKLSLRDVTATKPVPNDERNVLHVFQGCKICFISDDLSSKENELLYENRRENEVTRVKKQMLKLYVSKVQKDINGLEYAQRQHLNEAGGFETDVPITAFHTRSLTFSTSLSTTWSSKLKFIDSLWPHMPHSATSRDPREYYGFEVELVSDDDDHDHDHEQTRGTNCTESTDASTRVEDSTSVGADNENVGNESSVISTTSSTGADKETSFSDQKLLPALTAAQDAWVQCDRCQKWRRLPDRVNVDKLPSTWYCSMNRWDRKRNKCSVPEEQTLSTKLKATDLVDFRQRMFAKHFAQRLRSMNKAFSEMEENPDSSATHPSGSVPPTTTTVLSGNQSATSSSSKTMIDLEVDPALRKFVMCAYCYKRRLVVHGMDPAKVPVPFACWMNKWDELHASCSIPEEKLVALVVKASRERKIRLLPSPTKTPRTVKSHVKSPVKSHGKSPAKSYSSAKTAQYGSEDRSDSARNIAKPKAKSGQKAKLTTAKAKTKTQAKAKAKTRGKAKSKSALKRPKSASKGTKPLSSTVETHSSAALVSGKGRGRAKSVPHKGVPRKTNGKTSAESDKVDRRRKKGTGSVPSPKERSASSSRKTANVDGSGRSCSTAASPLTTSSGRVSSGSRKRKAAEAAAVEAASEAAAASSTTTLKKKKL